MLVRSRFYAPCSEGLGVMKQSWRRIYFFFTVIYNYKFIHHVCEAAVFIYEYASSMHTTNLHGTRISDIIKRGEASVANFRSLQLLESKAF